MIDADANLFAHLARVVAAVGIAMPEGGGPPDVAPPATLDTLVGAFGLSAFERDVVLLTAAADLDDTVTTQLGGPVTFSLALRALDEPHWSALSALRPLRRWSLIRVGAGPLVHAPLHCNDRVLLGLLGVPTAGDELASIGEWVPPVHDADVDASVAATAETAAAAIAARPTVVQVIGHDRDRGDTLCAAVATALGLDHWAIEGPDVPTEPRGVAELARTIEREVALGAVLVELRDGADHEQTRRTLMRLVESCRAPLLLRADVVLPLRRASTVVEIEAPSRDEELQAWRARAATVDVADDVVAELAYQFRIGRRAIRDAVADATAAGGSEAALRTATRRRARRDLEGLAHRIEPHARFDDLVLPEHQIRALHQIAAHARNRRVVHETWGFGATQPRGLGLSALFRGPSGTGKTSAAEIIAADLDVDLYRVDLSATVSKYIGETEKNLGRIFDAAEGLGGLLLFDEADALFGRRSQVHDAHDRYANVEVSYLLQRIETYEGLAVLTSNFESNIDDAFLRRLNYIVTFPFPDAAARRAIWERIFPPATPLAALDYAALARLNVSGGSIRNIALGAAALAADDGQAVTMPLLLRAAQSEYAKFDRPLSAVETVGWVA